MLNAQTLVLWGANIAETYPPYIRWIDLAREKGVKVIYVDPRRTPTSNHSDTQIMARPGTDGALILGLIRFLIHENLYDRDYVARYVNGFKELVASAEPYTPEAVSKITWLPPEKLIDLAKTLAQSKRDDHLDGRFALPFHQRHSDGPGHRCAAGADGKPFGTRKRAS